MKNDASRIKSATVSSETVDPSLQSKSVDLAGDLVVKTAPDFPLVDHSVKLAIPANERNDKGEFVENEKGELIPVFEVKDGKKRRQSEAINLPVQFRLPMRYIEDKATSIADRSVELIISELKNWYTETVIADFMLSPLKVKASDRARLLAHKMFVDNPRVEIPKVIKFVQDDADLNWNQSLDYPKQTRSGDPVASASTKVEKLINSDSLSPEQKAAAQAFLASMKV